MVLEPAIDEEKVMAMTKGERTRRARALVPEERAWREEEGSEEGSESDAEGSSSADEERTTDFQRTVLELLRGVDGQLKGMRADIQSLGTRVLAVERRLSQLEESTAAWAETEAEAENEAWGEVEEAGAGGETGKEATVAEGTDVLATEMVPQDEVRGDVGVGLAKAADTTVPAQDVDIGATLGEA